MVSDSIPLSSAMRIAASITRSRLSGTRASSLGFGCVAIWRLLICGLDNLTL